MNSVETRIRTSVWSKNKRKDANTKSQMQISYWHEDSSCMHGILGSFCMTCEAADRVYIKGALRVLQP